MMPDIYSRIKITLTELTISKRWAHKSTLEHTSPPDHLGSGPSGQQPAANGRMPGRAHGPSSTSPLYTVPPGHLLLHLSSGSTAAFSLPSYPAASFYLYIPTSHPVSRRKHGEDVKTGEPSSAVKETTFPLVVCVHGSARDAQGVRDRWSDMAEREGFVVLCPLFPVDMEVGLNRILVETLTRNRRWMGCIIISLYGILSSLARCLHSTHPRQALDIHALMNYFWRWSTWFGIDGGSSRLSSLA
jgi:hypothetical protein